MNGITIYKAPDRAVALRRQLAQIPEVLAALEPTEKAVFLASIAKTFAEYDAKELTEELQKAFRWIFKDVGYRSTDEGELGYLCVRVAEILKKYYSGFSIKDFRMAFEMSLTGELDDYLPKNRDGFADRGHYQNFNAEYVCKILNAYKSRRAWVMKKVNEKAPAPEPKRDMEEEKYYRNQTRMEVIQAFEFYKENGYLPFMSAIAERLYYNILSGIGLAEPISDTPQEQQQIIARTLSELTPIGEDYKAFTSARRKALESAFAKMASDGVELSNLIMFD